MIFRVLFENFKKLLKKNEFGLRKIYIKKKTSNFLNQYYLIYLNIILNTYTFLINN